VIDTLYILTLLMIYPGSNGVMQVHDFLGAYTSEDACSTDAAFLQQHAPGPSRYMCVLAPLHTSAGSKALPPGMFGK
jgi:hypothetical protein